jgi:hypothetical protein
MIVAWSKPFTLTSPLGTLDLSGATGYRFLPSQCSVGVGVRSSNDDVPAGDGAIFRPRFKQGVQMSITLELYDDPGDIAFDSDLQDAYDLLVQHLDACFYDDGRLQWTDATGSDIRMIDRIRTLQMPAVSGALPKDVSFVVESPFPYAMDLTEIDTALADGVASVLDNTGSAAFIPVIEVAGPTGAFTLVNADALDDDGNPMQLVYDDTMPGAAAVLTGHHIEFDFFKNSAFLDGNGADMLAGVDLTQTDFFPLVKGNNHITLTGATGTVKWQPAWN